MNNFIYVMGSIIFGIACYGMGWYAREAKYKRVEAKKVVDSLIDE